MAPLRPERQSARTLKNPPALTGGPKLDLFRLSPAGQSQDIIGKRFCKGGDSLTIFQHFPHFEGAARSLARVNPLPPAARRSRPVFRALRLLRPALQRQPRYIAGNISIQLMLKTIVEIISTMAEDPDKYRAGLKKKLLELADTVPLAEMAQARERRFSVSCVRPSTRC